MGSDEITEIFDNFKLKRSNYKYIVFHIKNNEILFERGEGKEMPYSEFIGTLPTDDARFVVADYEFETLDSRPTDKVVFICWIPETVKVRTKMTYSGTKQALLSCFQGVSVQLNATAFDEISEDVMLSACQS